MDCSIKVICVLLCLQIGVGNVVCLDDNIRDRIYDELKNNSIVFSKSLSECRMFTQYCTVKIYARNDVDLSNITIVSGNNKYLNYLRIETCESLNGTDLCVNETANSDFKVGVVYIKSKLVGVGSLEFQLDSENISYIVVIMEPNRWVDRLHRYFIMAFQITTAILMGILLDVKTILKIAKMPIPVIIGLVCQYGGMPLIAYAWIKILKISHVEALALFVYGCCPGGSGSNNWTILFNGDIDLSAIMTFVSTMGSLVFMPAWLYTVGQRFLTETKIQLPFLKLFLNLCITIGPCLVGLTLSKFFPKLKPIFLKVAKPFIVIMLISMLVFTLSIKYYVFLLASWRQWIVGPFIPWSGFLLGAIVSTIFRQPKNRIYTISIETGIQNIGIAFLIILYNFPSPQKDYAFIPLITVAMMTTIPLYIALMITKIAARIKKCMKKSSGSVEENDMDEGLGEKRNEPNEQSLFIKTQSNADEITNEKPIFKKKKTNV